MCAEIIDCPGINDRYRIKVVKNFNIFEMKILINFDESLYFINSCSKLLIFNFSLVIFCLYSYIDLYIFIFFKIFKMLDIQLHLLHVTIDLPLQDLFYVLFSYYNNKFKNNKLTKSDIRIYKLLYIIYDIRIKYCVAWQVVQIIKHVIEEFQ